MPKQNFFSLLQKELHRVDEAQIAKRHEHIIERFTDDPAPRGIINAKPYLIFNSNDYLGLRFHKKLEAAEIEATKIYGTGPGAVRFISGSLKIHKDLEKTVATFHNRDDAMVFSSAFATNLAVLFCLITGQSKDSVVSNETVVISDALNHRSIIDGIRVANLPKEQRFIYAHLDVQDLARVLEEQKGKFKRALVITDGIFSMLGEYADIKALKAITDQFDNAFEEGVFLIVDDSHGVGAFGNGRGVEGYCKTQADVLIGTFGKGFGSDGGYVVADEIIIDYLRESAATYIYSNSVSPGVAAAAKTAIDIVASVEGQKLLQKLDDNVALFKKRIKDAGFTFAADSVHPIQPILIGNAEKTKKLTEKLYDAGILVTNINYPVVPPGKDEIRAQVSAAHTAADIDTFAEQAEKAGKALGIL